MILAKQFDGLIRRWRVLPEFIEAMLSGGHYGRCRLCNLLPKLPVCEAVKT